MKETKDFCEFAGFGFDRETNTLWRGGELVLLSPKPLELLRLLIERDGGVVSKKEIFDTVWSGTFVEDGVLTQNVYTLRQVLGKNADGRQIIENVPRRGYRLATPVSRSRPSEPNEDEAVATSIAGHATEQRQKRTWLFRAAAVALVAVLAGGAIAAYLFSIGRPESRPRAELKFTRITDNGEVSYVAISAEGGRVAYTRGSELFVRERGSNKEIEVSLPGVERVGCIQFSRDGNFIYFGTVMNHDERGSISRVSMNGDGTIESSVNDVWSGFSISPDGTQLAFIRNLPESGSQAVMVKNLLTGAERTAATTKLPEEFYWNNYPAWSPDGKKIAVVAVTQTEHISRIVIADESGTAEVKPQGFRNIEQIVWTADGNGFYASANEGDNFQIWRLGLDGANKRITNDLNSYLGIAVSQDRKQLISRQRIYYSNIWAGRPNEPGGLKQLTEGTSRNDGLNGLAWLGEDVIVYSSNDLKIRDWNLWTVNLWDGSRKKLTSDSDAQNDFPAVSPDGKWIYFASDRGKQRRIWKIDAAAGGPPIQATFGEDEAHLFPQISPDGRFLYFIIKSGRSSTVGRASLTERAVQELSGKTARVPGNVLSLSPDGRSLAFQNVGGSEGSRSPTLRIAIMSANEPDRSESVEIEALWPWVTWSPDSGCIDFVAGTLKDSYIGRRRLGTSETTVLSRFPSTIFKFAWSPSGEKLAVARGELVRDVVLLSEFGD